MLYAVRHVDWSLNHDAACFVGRNEELAVAFGFPGSLLCGRYYMFWRNGKAMTLIYEVWSPRLEDFLGKLQLETAPTWTAAETGSEAAASTPAATPDTTPLDREALPSGATDVASMSQQV